MRKGSGSPTRRRQSVKTPAKRKATVEKNKSPGTGLKARAAIISLTAQKRIKACILMENGMGPAEACKKAEIKSHSSFTKGKWFHKFQEGGMEALLEDNRHGSAWQMSPNSEEIIKQAARRGKNAPDALEDLRRERKESGDERPEPGFRTVQKVWRECQRR